MSESESLSLLVVRSFKDTEINGRFFFLSLSLSPDINRGRKERGESHDDSLIFTALLFVLIVFFFVYSRI